MESRGLVPAVVDAANGAIRRSSRILGDVPSVGSAAVEDATSVTASLMRGSDRHENDKENKSMLNAVFGSKLGAQVSGALKATGVRIQGQLGQQTALKTTVLDTSVDTYLKFNGAHAVLWISLGLAVLLSNWGPSAASGDILARQVVLNFSKPYAEWSNSGPHYCFAGGVGCTSVVRTDGYIEMDVARALLMAIVLPMIYVIGFTASVWSAPRGLRNPISFRRAASARVAVDEVDAEVPKGTSGVASNRRITIESPVFGLALQDVTWGVVQSISETLILVVCAHMVGLRQVEHVLLITGLVLMHHTTREALLSIVHTLATTKVNQALDSWLGPYMDKLAESQENELAILQHLAELVAKSEDAVNAALDNLKNVTDGVLDAVPVPGLAAAEKSVDMAHGGILMASQLVTKATDTAAREAIEVATGVLENVNGAVRTSFAWQRMGLVVSIMALVFGAPAVLLWVTLFLPWGAPNSKTPYAVSATLWLWFAFRMLDIVQTVLRLVGGGMLRRWLPSWLNLGLFVVGANNLGFLAVVVSSVALLKNTFWTMDVRIAATTVIV